MRSASRRLVEAPLRSRSSVASDGGFDFDLQFIDTLAGIALGFLGCGLEPEIVNLGGDAIFACHPAIAEDFELVLAADGCGFRVERRQQITGCRSRAPKPSSPSV